MRNQFLLRAIEIAIDNVRNNSGGPFGSLVVRDGKIIAEGVNLVTSTNDPTAHAEVVAIRNACQHLQTFELNDCEIYTSCEPCPMCLSAIYWARASKIIFGASRQDAAAAGFDDEFLYHEVVSPHSSRSIPIEQLHREEALATFNAWRNQHGKTLY